MTPNDDDHPRLSNEDARFVERIAEVWAPPEPTALRGARFDARLAERLARGSSPRRALAFAAAVAAIALFVLARPGAETGPRDATHVSVTAPETGATSEETLVAVVSDPWTDAERDRDEALPEDYQAIASLLY